MLRIGACLVCACRDSSIDVFFDTEVRQGEDDVEVLARDAIENCPLCGNTDVQVIGAVIP